MVRNLALILAFVALSPRIPLALAEDCEVDCPSGQVRSAFLDGNHMTCSCLPADGVQMEDNPADGNPPSGGEGQES